METKCSGFDLITSSTSSKLLSLVAPGLLTTVTLCLWLNTFSVMPFDNESPKIETLFLSSVSGVSFDDCLFFYFSNCHWYFYYRSCYLNILQSRFKATNHFFHINPVLLQIHDQVLRLWFPRMALSLTNTFWDIHALFPMKKTFEDFLSGL